jgi:golgi-specific brefeldin A-resistance guanine nucleotide exchange factor 1
VRENLKNVLLFMVSSGHLVSPKQDPSKEKIWTETWKRIDRFLPDMRTDLALEEPEEEPAPAKVEAAPTKAEPTPAENESAQEASSTTAEEAAKGAKESED